MTGQDIFDQAMYFMGKVKTNGSLNTIQTAKYEDRAISFLNSWQWEIQKLINETLASPITALTDNVTVQDNISGAYFLATNFLLAEADLDKASYYAEKYEECKKLLLDRQLATEEDITDSYAWSSAEGF